MSRRQLTYVVYEITLGAIKTKETIHWERGSTKSSQSSHVIWCIDTRKDWQWSMPPILDSDNWFIFE